MNNQEAAKNELEKRFSRTGLETKRRTESEIKEALSKKIYSFWIDGEMWRNYVTEEECQQYLAIAPQGEQRPVVR
jgi:hypothetical protein